MSDNLKIYPHAIEIESAVLGAFMREPMSYYRVATLLKPECFYPSANQVVFEAIQKLADKHRKIDELTVTEELIRMKQLNEIGGAYYVTKLTNGVVSAVHLEEHVMIVVQKFMQREMIHLCSRYLNAAYDDGNDPLRSIDDLMKDASKIQGMVTGKGFVKLSDAVVNTINNSEFRMKSGNVGVKLKHENLRFIIPSLHPGDFMIIAARPSVGKTAFALETALEAAISGKKTAYFSMEMSTDQLVKRVLSNTTDTSFTSVYNWRMSDEQMGKIINSSGRFEKWPLWIDDSFNTSTRNIYSKALNLKLEEGLDLIVIDYLQLIGRDKSNQKRYGNKNEEVTDISRDCKGLAKELGIPVVALSQMSREMEKQNREPRLSDLRESGAIEQDADIVAFLYRIGDDDPNAMIRQIGFKVEKHRNGALGKTSLWLNGNYQRFTEEDPSPAWKPVDPNPKLFYQGEPMSTKDDDEGEPF